MEQDYSLPPDQVAELLCDELEACIKSYLPQEGEQQEQEEQKLDQARDEAALQLYNRSIELLREQGFGEVVRQALTDNFSYYAHLFGRVQNQFFDINVSVQMGEEAAEFIRGSLNKPRQEVGQESSMPPQPQNYLHHFPPPYDDLFTGVFFLDTLFERARFVAMRDTMKGKMEGQSAG